MWYVRFGGEEFGPFGKSELDEFIGQLGTADAVEVRKADEGQWSSVESDWHAGDGGVPEVVTQDDDKTLMSSDMSPELLAEFRALLDEDAEPEPLITEGAMPRFSPPKTRADGVPDAVIGRKVNESSVADVSLDELLTQSGDRSPLKESHQERSKPAMLLASPDQGGGQAIPNRQNTTVSQTPDMKPPEAVEKKRGSRVTATPPAIPSTSPTKPKASTSPQPFPDPPSTPQRHVSPSKSSSTLLPSRPPKKAQAKTAQANKAQAKTAQANTAQSKTAEFETSKPQASSKPQAMPFQVKRSNRARTAIIAVLVTTVVGGIGAYGIWSKKQASQNAQTSTALNKARSVVATPSIKKVVSPVKTPKVETSEAPATMVFAPTKEQEPEPPSDRPGANTPPQDDAKAAGAEANKPKPVPVLKKKPIAKPSKVTTVQKKVARRVPKKKSTKPAASKPLSKKWVRKKSTPILASLNRAAIETVMKKQRAKLKNCKGAKGVKVTVSLEILSSGVVRKCQVFDRGRLDDITKQCISATLRRAVFPRTKTAVAQIRIPVNL